MSYYSKSKNNELKEDLEKAIKRITVFVSDVKRKLPPEDDEQIIEYRDSLITTFNLRYAYINKFSAHFTPTTLSAFKKAHEKYVKRTLTAIQIFGFTFDKPANPLELIDKNTVVKTGPPYGHSEEASGIDSANLAKLLENPDFGGSQESLASIDSISEKVIEEKTQSNSDTTTNLLQLNPKNPKMVLTNVEFLKLAGAQIPRAYAGDPIQLKTLVMRLSSLNRSLEMSMQTFSKHLCFPNWRERHWNLFRQNPKILMQ